MKVKMTTSMAGPSVRRVAGEVCEMPKEEALRLIERGFAEPVKTTARKAVAKRGRKATARK